MPTLSTVLPVHAGTASAFLDLALRSMAAQTRPADETVVVCDGDLTPQHEAVLDTLTGALPLTIVRLQRQSGITAALRAGMDVASGEWVARMDGDDYSEPHRLATQLASLEGDEVDVLGSAMSLFETDHTNPFGVRSMPSGHDRIVRLLPRMNPLNHPTVVLRRASYVAAGGYRGPDGMEDYDLWARMAVAGARFDNLAEPLVRFRADSSARDRRRTARLRAAEQVLQDNLHEYGVTSAFQRRTNLVLRNGLRRLPPRMLATFTAFAVGRTAPESERGGDQGEGRGQEE